MPPQGLPYGGGFYEEIFKAVSKRPSENQDNYLF